MKSANEYLPTGYWLMKSEPDVFSFADLLNRKNKGEFWDGVRNYQARNFMRDNMKVGHKILFYHSNAAPPGIAGIAEVIKAATADMTAFDPESKYFDPDTSTVEPRWLGVTIGKPQAFKQYISLDMLKQDKVTSSMLVCRRGQRLSVQPVSQAEFERVKGLGMLIK
jgi:predicted RNA-binding protein with PUA-like domain